MGGGKHEADACLGNAFGDLFRGEVDFDAQSREHVGGARFRRERAVAMLGDLKAGARRDECRAGRDIVGARSIAAGADDIDRAGGRFDAGSSSRA